MPIDELRLQLAAVAQRLPAAELADAQDKIELAHGHLASAWEGSGHPNTLSALDATGAAAERLCEIIAALAQVSGAIDQYASRL